MLPIAEMIRLGRPAHSAMSASMPRANPSTKDLASCDPTATRSTFINASTSCWPAWVPARETAAPNSTIAVQARLGQLVTASATFVQIWESCGPIADQFCQT
jgi:hypothetical protein